MDYEIIIICIGIMAAAILFHEIGHLYYLNGKLNKGVKVRWYYSSIIQMGFKVGYKEDYKNLTNMQYISVNLYGVLIGMIPIFLAAYLITPLLLFLLIPYLMGSKKDIREIIKFWGVRKL